jgi:hypothetical protein
VDYVAKMLDEIGLGRQRLMLFHLPGSAKQDMALGAAADPGATSPEELTKQMRAIRDEVAARLGALPDSPMRKLAPKPDELPEASNEVDLTEESDE